MRKLFCVVLSLTFFFAFQSSALSEEQPIEAIIANVAKFAAAQTKAAPSITVSEFNSLIEKQESFFEILDVRTTEEYVSGHIADAIHSDRNKLEWVTPKKITDPNVPIYVYCQAGTRGAIATLRLIEIGYTNVTNVTGGVKAWVNAGYPLYNSIGKFTFPKGGFGKQPE